MLRNLRVNCFLAPFLPALLAALALGYLAWSAQHQAEARLRRVLVDWVSASALRLERGDELRQLWASHPHWRGLALVRFDDDDRPVFIQQVGQQLPMDVDDPPPALFRAGVLPQAWADGQVAAPVLDAQGGLQAVLYGVYESPEPWDERPLLASTAALLLLGGLLAWYLSRRIYRPVESLDRAARVALEGGTEDLAIQGSVETAGVSASVRRLAREYRSQAHTHADEE